jgi:PAS domain S-box-containing protein
MQALLNNRKSAVRLEFLEHLSDGVLVLDRQMVIRAVNGALEKLLGWTPSELIGRTCADFFGYELPGPPAEHPQLVTLTTRTGELRELEVSFTRLQLAEYSLDADSYNLLIVRDVSAQRRHERIQTEFIATASHQLRSPLASLKTSISLLLENAKDELRPQLYRLLQNIDVSTRRMERLVNDLIELTNLQSGRIRLQLRRLEVQKLIEQVVAESRIFLDDREQKLKLEIPATPLFIEADGSRMAQVVRHLLSNAGKFSPPGSKIELKVRRAIDNIEFSVRDYGIGIAPDEQPLIFEKFYQAQTIENSQQIGSGLGLPLAKVLIELHGGRLWFESRPNAGSTFYFSLPAHEG